VNQAQTWPPSGLLLPAVLGGNVPGTVRA